MTRHTMRSLAIVAALSVLIATEAAAEPGPDSIVLEQIGAVRMATPDEVEQQRAPAPSRDERELQQIPR